MFDKLLTSSQVGVFVRRNAWLYVLISCTYLLRWKIKYWSCRDMVAVETGWDGVRREDDDRKENIGILINLFQFRSIYFNQEISRSHEIRNFYIQCNYINKILETWWWPYIAEPCNVVEGCI
jgi:hypothetical protein